MEGMSVDHSSGVAAPKADPVFLHVKSGMTVIVTGTDGTWRMADVIWVDGGARNPKVPTLFQVADVDTGVINWVNADLVTHIVPRVRLGKRWALVKPSTTNRDAALQLAGTLPATGNAGEFGWLHPVFRDC